MKATRLKMVNYRKHVDLEINLTGSMIGLTGDNGSGKSRLMMAIRDCLTGEFQPTKEKNITWGQKTGMVEGDFEVSSSRSMTVHRDLPSGKAWLKFSDQEEPIVGTNKVNQAILAELGTDKSILMHIVFVGQREIEGLLFDQTGIKARLAQRFFGIDKAQVLEKAIGTAQGMISFDSQEQQVPTLSAQIAQIRGELDHHRSLLDQLGSLVSPDEIFQTEARWRQASDFVNREAGLRALAIAAEEMNKQIAAGAAQVESGFAELARISTDDLDRLYAYHLNVQQKQGNQRYLRSAIERSETALAEVGPEPLTEGTLHELSVQRADADLQCRIATEQITTLRQEMNNLLGTPICPKCGQAVDTSHRERLESEVHRLEQLNHQENIPRRRMTSEAYEQAFEIRQAWKNQTSTVKIQLDVLNGQLTALGEVPDIKAEPEKFLNARRQVDAMRTTLEGIRTQVDTARAGLAENLRQQEEYRLGMQDGAAFGDPQDLVRQLEGLRARNSAQQQHLAHIQHIELALSRAQWQLDQAQKAALDNRISQEYQKALGRLREAFHPDGAPKVLVSRTVQRLEEGVNRYLTLLDTEFRVRARSGLEFDYLFESGIGDADDLSVGQQVDVAWAFRLSAMQSLGASVGMMTMDEPTAPLDKRTKQHFNLLLDHLRQIAAAGNMQFIVATHDEEMVGFCDQHISL